MEDKKYFCYEIYKNISVWSFNGSINYNPCSFYQGYTSTDNTLDLGKAWTSSGRKQIKIAVENNQLIPGCQYCYNAENSGLESRRRGAKKSWEQFHHDSNIDIDAPQSLDYSVGNLCNLKCMICGPRHSTTWIPDFEKIHPDADVSVFKFDKFNQIEIANNEQLKNIVNVHFHGGGEPLMSSSHINLLKNIDEVRGLSDVRVFYNTNGTVKVSDDVLALWEKCKLVELYFSIDDVGTRFEYQRTGAKWQEVCNNLDWYNTNAPDNYMYNINCSWGYLNLYYLDELVDWYNNKYTVNRYGDPTNLIFQKVIGSFGIRSISPDIKYILLEKFKNYPQLIDLVESLSVIEKMDNAPFWKAVNAIDLVRGNDFSKLCPEWSKLL